MHLHMKLGENRTQKPLGSELLEQFVNIIIRELFISFAKQNPCGFFFIENKEMTSLKKNQKEKVF